MRKPNLKISPKIIAVGTALSLTLSACGSSDEVASGEFDDGDGGKGEYSLNQKDGENQLTIKTDDGEVRINSGTGAGADTKLPLGLKLYPGAEVLSSMTGTGEGKSGGMVSFKTDVSRDEVMEFYKKQAQDQGIKIEAEMTMGDRKMFAGNNDGDQNLSVTAATDNGKTVVTVIGGMGN